MRNNSSNIKTAALVLAVLLVNVSTLLAQQEQHNRPKVGLVLSGGGAKGFAHVGVLKVLEEHNIPIDYIGGTSIGSIVGALYSIGYSSQQLADIVLTQDWEALFIDESERIYMPFYEKEDQERYQVSMRFQDGKLYIPNYAFTNNGVIKLFSDLTVGYHDVDDFNKLPIPFLCVAVDFQTGEEVLINSGFLPDALAASMAIPGVFPSIKTDSTVFIDGGIRNNFPVDHVRAMGADIIIGVDVGAAMKTGDELDKLSAVIDQLTTMLGNSKFQSNREDCDVYMLPDILEYSTADFTTVAGAGLMAKGERKAREHIDEIKAIEKEFEGLTFPKRKGYSGIDSAISEMVTQFDIYGTRLEDEAVLGIMGISRETNMQCSVEDLQVGLERLHASMRFSRVHYKLLKDNSDSTYHLMLNLVENSENFINFGAHYNTQDAVSLLFNGTMNNLIFRNSRISMDVKVSEVPAFNFRYDINRGSLPGLGVKYGYRRRLMGNYVDGIRIGEGSVGKNYFEVNTNSIVNDNLTVGLGARYEKYTINSLLGDFPLKEDKYGFLLYRFFLEIDTKDKAYYPTSGVKYYSHTDVITDNGYELNNKIPSIVTFLSMNQTFSMNNYWVVSPSVHAQLQYVTSNPPSILYDTYVGGCNQPHDILSQIPFWGLRWGEYRANNILALSMDNRFKLGDKHYAYFNGNAFAETKTLEALSLNSLNYRVGFAIGYSYNSLVGPIEIFFSMSNDLKLRNYINIGYYF